MITTGTIEVPDCTTPYRMEPIMWAWGSVVSIAVIIAVTTIVLIWIDHRGKKFR